MSEQTEAREDSATDTTADVARHLEEAEKTLDRQLDWIRAVDSKTPVVIALDTGMLGALAAVAPAPADLSIGVALWLALGVAALVASLGLCAAATFPQTTGPLGSLIFFGEIAKQSSAEYVKAARYRSPRAYLHDVLTQAHRNAEIAADKYGHVRRATFWLAVSIPLWLSSIYICAKGQP